ncbi:hypothetical protein HOY82DRAFT_634723 [Tuber indicum]|nr:hypothetical protein HOY82DRAFT_634723 [Tuber indicum]
MAQNPNLQYVHGNAAGALQRNNLPAIGIVGQINARRATRRRINDYKTDVGFALYPNGRALYAAWRVTVKDQMCARNFVDNKHFADAEFAVIVMGMRRLRPGCYSIVTAHAAGNLILQAGIDEEIIQLVKDVGKKLATTLLKNPPAAPGQGAAQVAGNLDGDQGENQGDQDGNQDGNQGGDQGENQGGDQDENQDGDQDGNQGGNQGGDQDANRGAVKGEPQVGNQDENQDGNQGGDQGANQGANQGAAKGEPQVGNQDENQGANQGAAQGEPQVGNQDGNEGNRDVVAGSRGPLRGMIQTGEGRKQIRRAPHQPISDADYIFIQSDTDVRTWLLTNPVADDPLDLLVYGERDPEDLRVRGEVVSIAGTHPVAERQVGTLGMPPANAIKSPAKAHESPAKAVKTSRLSRVDQT